MQKTLFSNPERPLSGVAHALDALELLAAAGQELLLGEISGRLGMSKAGAHRLLATLVGRGYAERRAGGRYHLGLRVWELGRAVPQLGIVAVAAPIMDELTRATEESSILGVLSGSETVYLHRVDAAQAVRVHTEVGSRLPAHCTSTGLALLAALPEPELSAALPMQLDALSPESITSREILLQTLAQTRARGYATNVGGWRIDVAGAAAAILDAAAYPVGAVCIALPRYRVTQAKLRVLGRQVREAADRIGARLTDTGPRNVAGTAR